MNVLICVYHFILTNILFVSFKLFNKIIVSNNNVSFIRWKGISNQYSINLIFVFYNAYNNIHSIKTTS